MIRFEQIQKTYKTKHGDVHALDKIDLQIEDGEFLVVRGPSGSGKSTFLLTLGGMLRPSSGRVMIGETDLYQMSVSARAQFRAKEIGFVFQMFHLVPYLTILENVLLSNGLNDRLEAEKRATNLLHKLGLADRLTHKPAELSAGEKQRTAITRAMLPQPKLILADEPTGNLDPKNAEEVIRHLVEYNKEGGTVVMVTHGHNADDYANRIVVIENGQIQ
ncbi:ATP-binding cassette domain-containing protein [bacterium]|nr:ATP-binding cassette domain-containing protein [bacterium]